MSEDRTPLQEALRLLVEAVRYNKAEQIHELNPETYQEIESGIRLGLREAAEAVAALRTAQQESEGRRLALFDKEQIIADYGRRLDSAGAEIAALRAERDTLQQRLDKPFVSYEVVQTTEKSERGVTRYRVYGLRPEGYRVELDQLYLRDHDVAIAAAEQRLQSLRTWLERYHDEHMTSGGQLCDCTLCVETRAALLAADPKE